MEKEKSQGLQSVFLNHIRKGAVPSTIFLINGVKLQGIITWFDNFSILLRRDNHVQMVYKHAISTIMPAVPVNLYLKDENGNAETIEHKIEEDDSNSPKNVENIVT